MMYHRIEGMCKEVHELVQWGLKMKVRVPLSVGEKPNLQPAVFHKIRMNQGPVENSDDQVNGRRHILMRGVCCVQRVLMKALNLTSRPQESLYRKGSVQPSNFGRLKKGKNFPEHYLNFA